MRLSISNIAWPAEWDSEIFEEMKKLGFEGLEIAPTRIFQLHPYEDLQRVKQWHETISSKFLISSMQSILYGMKENIFNGNKEFNNVLEYTKKAIKFAEIINCKNLVFGCPKNRNGSIGKKNIALKFFRAVGNYALKHNTVVAIEAVPQIYNTDFLNTTKDALNFVKETDCKGIRLNFDLGTSMANGENLSIINNNSINFVNHIHISELGLKKIEKRTLHADLINLLKTLEYNRFISIEMAQQKHKSDVIETMEYINSYVF